MKPLVDGLLTARLVDPCDNDGDDGSVPSAIAIHALYATGPQSPPLGGASRARIRSGGTLPKGASGANGTVQRLLTILFLLIVVGCAVQRWCHHDHGSYLPQWAGSGWGIPSIESMDAEPILKTDNETAEFVVTNGATASPTASPTSSSTAADTASAAASPLTEASASGSTLTEASATATSSALDTALDTAIETAVREAVAALERQIAALEVETAEDESPRHKAALLEELLSHHRRAADHAAAADVEQRLRGLGAAKFVVGDVVEQLYNANTLKCRILYPFRVEEVHYGTREESSQEPKHAGFDEEHPVPGSQPEGETALVGMHHTYTIVRLSDGRVVEQMPESFLRPYVPYDPDTRALCNVGGADIGEERLFSCSILEYILPGDAKERGATPPPTQHVRIKRDGEAILKSRYRVTIHGRDAEDEAIVAMNRMQHRL